MYRSSRYWACSCIESVIRSVHNPGDGAQNSRKLQDTSATSYVSAAAIERVIPNQAQLLKRGDAEARRRIWSELANSAPDINTHGLNLPIFLRVSAFKTSIPVSTCGCVARNDTTRLEQRMQGLRQTE